MMFRGKRKYNDEWIEGHLVILNYPKEDFYIAKKGNNQNWHNTEFIEILPSSVGMSTGLKDKNGKEIFGSIPINGEMSKGGDIDQNGGFVIWNEELAGFCLQFKKDRDISLIDSENWFEVIGNQTDNDIDNI